MAPNVYRNEHQTMPLLHHEEADESVAVGKKKSPTATHESIPPMDASRPGPCANKTDGSDSDSDAANRRLVLKLRLLYVSYFAALGSLLPYLSLYYNSLGHSGKVIGSLAAITPIITIIVSPLWGHAFDNTTNPTRMLMGIMIISLLGRLSKLCFTTTNYMAIMTALTSMFGSPIKPLMDSLTIQCLQQSQSKTKFGQIRVYGLIGFGGANIISGYLLNYTTTFESLFLFHTLLHIPTFVVLYSMMRINGTTTTTKQSNTKSSTQQQQSNNNIFTKFKTMFQLLSKDSMLFLILIIFMGASSALSENFAFVRMHEIGGTGSDMGLCRLFSTIAGMYSYSSSIKRGIGIILLMNMIAYCMRFTVYGWIMTLPYHAYIADTIRGLSFGLFWSSSNVYATQMVPAEYRATSLMILNTCYNGIGRSFGSITFGYMQSILGTQATFQYAAMWNIALASSFSLYLFVLASSSTLLVADGDAENDTNTKEQTTTTETNTTNTKKGDARLKVD